MTKTMLPRALRATVLALLLPLSACNTVDSFSSREPEPTKPTTVFSIAGRQMTGVAAVPGRSGSGTRLFVSFPRWHGTVPTSVAEVLPGEILRPYPDAIWNSWTESEATSGGSEVATKFVCVQSVVGDERGDLWILDPGSPRMAGVVPGAAKLVHVDTRTDKVMRTYSFDAKIAPKESYLNDVRIDRNARRAYITDSGRAGLVIVNLDTGDARRVLDNHLTTRADPGVVPVIDRRELRYASGPDKGKAPQVNSDGIALDAKRGYLYWQALTGRRLYRVRTALLNDFSSTESAVSYAVEDLGRTVVTDGIEVGYDGEILFTALERNAIMARDRDGKIRTIAESPLLSWPDSLAFGPDGTLYVTTSQIHRTPWFDPAGTMPTEPFRVIKIPY